MVILPMLAARSDGPPSPSLGSPQRLVDSIDLLVEGNELDVPNSTNGSSEVFTIQSGASADAVAVRLEQAGLIQDSNVFRTYLAWTGMDTRILPGNYLLSPALSARNIASALVTADLTIVPFSVLPGWRLEEIAAALPTSGLAATPQAFLAAAANPGLLDGIVPSGSSINGFLFPGRYKLPRTTDADQLVKMLTQSFVEGLPADDIKQYTARGLTVYQAVTLASIVQREAVVATEMPMIASVFYNRLAIGMKLQSDPTVQYALGFNPAESTWWTDPLSLQDLQVVSAYNTYQVAGLPPGPICNPGLAALQAVAYPATTNYYYFQARCDDSGLHNFAQTFAQHLQNNCP
jgi:UPF0755 protein